MTTLQEEQAVGAMLAWGAKLPKSVGQSMSGRCVAPYAKIRTGSCRALQPASRKGSSTVRKQANLDPKVTVQMLYKQSLGASLLSKLRLDRSALESTLAATRRVLTGCSN